MDRLKRNLILVIALIQLLPAGCSKKKQENIENISHDVLVIATLEALDDICNVLRTLDENSQPGTVIASTTSVVKHLVDIDKKWKNSSQPSPEQWEDLINSYGEQMVKTVGDLDKVHGKFNLSDTKITVCDILSCWIFDNETIVKYAEKLFTSDTIEIPFPTMLFFMHNSNITMTTDAEGYMNWKFYEAGLIMQMTTDGKVHSVKKLQ